VRASRIQDGETSEKDYDDICKSNPGPIATDEIWKKNACSSHTAWQLVYLTGPNSPVMQPQAVSVSSYVQNTKSKSPVRCAVRTAAPVFPKRAGSARSSVVADHSCKQNVGAKQQEPAEGAHDSPASGILLAGWWHGRSTWRPQAPRAAAPELDWMGASSPSGRRASELRVPSSILFPFFLFTAQVHQACNKKKPYGSVVRYLCASIGRSTCMVRDKY
jgi:hypothetical protein